MAKTKSRKDGDSTDTQVVSASGVEGHTKNYDPVLVSLFAQSVSSIQIQFTCSQSVDLV